MATKITDTLVPAPHPTVERRDMFGRPETARVDLPAEHCTLIDVSIRTATVRAIGDALAEIATKLQRRQPGVTLHYFATDLGTLPFCTVHRSVGVCWHASDPAAETCRTVEMPATDVTVTATGLPIHDGTWTVAGVLTSDAAGVVTATSVGGSEDGWATGHTALAGQCDHCRRTMRRRVTVLLTDAAGDVRPVGRSCLADYAGGKIRAEVLAELTRLGERIRLAFGVVAGAEPDTAPVVEVVALARMLADRFGFIRAGYGGRNEEDNRTRLRKCVAPFDGEQSDIAGCDVTDADRDAARADIATILAAPADSDYIANLQAIVGAEWTQVTGNGNKLGLIASLPIAADRARRDAVEAAAPSLPDAYIGAEGEKVQISGTVALTLWTQGDFPSYLVKIETPVGAVKCFTTAAAMTELGEGDQVTLVATVKRHDVYQGRKETTLTRPKLVAV